MSFVRLAMGRCSSGRSAYTVCALSRSTINTPDAERPPASERGTEIARSEATGAATRRSRAEGMPGSPTPHTGTLPKSSTDSSGPTIGWSLGESSRRATLWTGF